MSSSLDRHRRLRAVFDEVLLLPPSARAAYLTDACAGDTALRSDVERLLAVHQDAHSFLEDPPGLIPANPDTEPFADTDRFRVVRRLGSGGMGVVFDVHDRLRDERVALKTLRRTGAADLYRLKQEFRSLADVTHPNLVCLYELFVEDERSFFTMELVHGVSFVEYVRGEDESGISVDRMIPALRQLIDGVSMLHSRGKLHRDIKPSNVLVTPEGRVVILDFGMMAEAPSRRSSDADHVRGGTPAYMSPEESAGDMPSEASDWYGVGVTLYETLTGTVPFDGSVSEVLLRKRMSDPPAPAQLAPERVPADVSAVCMGLLRRSPEQRLTGRAAWRALTDDIAPSHIEIEGPTVQATPFVGRSPQLRALHDSRHRVSDGHAMVMSISGPSGIGKSALVRHFLTQLGRGDGDVVLSGRCYENESVPYKALDGVIDDLSRALGSMPADLVMAVLPPDVSALTRVFPVLRQVGAVAAASRDRELESVDPLRVRRRAFDALASLLRQLASRARLVVWIDDLQWADADSMVLLDELLGPPNPPAMLTVLSFRSEEIAAKPSLQALVERSARGAGAALSLEPITDEEARVLISDLLPSGATLTESDKVRMTRDAGGSPFVLEQLALYAGVAGPGASRSPTFAAMFESRVGDLQPEARRFLETLAICGRPVAPEIVCDACAIARDRQSLMVMLRASHLIRSSGSSARVETYHDRIREALTDRVAPEAVRLIHARMAASLVARQSDDCEALFEHYRGAGNLESASTQAGLAAEKAGRALAFDRAASFYDHALTLAPSETRAREWSEGLATALANAGRPAEAAEAYLRAAEGADHSQHVELRRRAAEQFLTGGHIDRGLDLVRSGLESVGLSYASSPRTAALRLVWRRLRLRMRGLDFVPRRAEEIDREVLQRIDTCWAAATGLALVDLVTASDFVAQGLHMALDAGEPARVSRALALESAARSVDWLFRSSGRPLAERAEQLSRDLGTPLATAMNRLADSMSACATGQWLRALRSSEEALTILRDRCVGVTWEINIAQNMYIWALMYRGEVGEVSRLVSTLLVELRRRGNFYLPIELCTRSNFVWLAADDPDEGERETLAALAQWSQRGFHRQHFSAMLARVQTALYRGDAETAWQLLQEQEAKLRRSMLMQVQALRVEAHYLRGRVAVAIAAQDPSARRRFLSIARANAHRISREQMPWSDPLARLVEAGIASVEGRRDDVVRLLNDAVDGFFRAEMKLYLAVSRRRLGQVQDDQAGRDLRQSADAWMAGQGIKNPDGLTRMLAPGFPEV